MVTVALRQHHIIVCMPTTSSSYVMVAPRSIPEMVNAFAVLIMKSKQSQPKSIGFKPSKIQMPNPKK
jgi:hypothetical protein